MSSTDQHRPFLIRFTWYHVIFQISDCQMQSSGLCLALKLLSTTVCCVEIKGPPINNVSNFSRLLTPSPQYSQFFSTICQQFWPIFDTSPPTNDRHHLWMAPCRLTGRFCLKLNKHFFCCYCTSLKAAINAICMAWNTTFLVGSNCSLF